MRDILPYSEAYSREWELRGSHPIVDRQTHNNISDRYRVSDIHIRREKNVYRILLVKAIKLITDVGLFYFAWLFFRYGQLSDMSPVGFRYNLFMTGAYVILFYWFSQTYNAFMFGYFRIRQLVLAQFFSQIFSVTIIYILVSIAWHKFQAPWVFLILLAIYLAIDILWAYFGSYYYFKLNPKRKTILIYRDELSKRRFGQVKGKPLERLYDVTEEYQFDGTFSEIEPKLHGYDAIFVAGVNSSCRNGILKYCKELGIPGFVLPHLGDTIIQGAIHIQSFDSPVLYVNRKTLDPAYAFIKRTFDIVSSGLALILLSPLMLVTALIIKCYDKGPVLYKQVRLTRNGREFKILKFRSMRVDAEKDGVARLSSGDKDDRITPVGRFIRKCRIDELPQLINIFKGDMSVVGPRPERPEIAEKYYKSLPGFKLRLQVRAGLTGYAQVYGKYNTDPYEKLEFDLLYINKMNIFTDLGICFATAGILFLPESTEGVAVGATTAMDYENAADSTENDAETVAK